jgi:hypothetical protein
MAEDITTLQAQLDALKAARASGVKTASFGERSATKFSDKEIVAQIAALENEIATMQGAPRPRGVVIRGGKGW